MKISIGSFMVLLVLWMTCCSSSDDSVDPNLGKEQEEVLETTAGKAEVTNVSVSGEENQYIFSVTISSPDLGCHQYADWWEVIDLEGKLVYRRILAHSHVNEQPFTRTSSSITISSTTEIYIRAHMNTTSYGNKVFKGTVAGGFVTQNLDIEFAKDLEKIAPLPENCAF